jgi:hypothetical protein
VDVKFGGGGKFAPPARIARGERAGGMKATSCARRQADAPQEALPTEQEMGISDPAY